MATPRKPKRINAAYLKKAPSEVHDGFATYIEATTGQTVTADTVALVQRLYPLYLKSPAVVEAREKAKAEKEAADAAKRAEKERKIKQRLARVEAQRRKLLSDLGLDPAEVDAQMSVVVEAADRFQQPDPEVEADLAEVVDNADEEPESEEVTLEDEEDSEDEDDLWEDDEDEAEDF